MITFVLAIIKLTLLVYYQFYHDDYYFQIGPQRPLTIKVKV